MPRRRRPSTLRLTSRRVPVPSCSLTPPLDCTGFTFPCKRAHARVYAFQHSMANRSASVPPRDPQHAAASLHAARSSCTGVQPAALIAGAGDWEGTRGPQTLLHRSLSACSSPRNTKGPSVPCSGVCSAPLCAALQERETERLQRIENLSQSIKRKEEFVNKLVESTTAASIPSPLSPSGWLLSSLARSRSLRHWWRRWARPSTRSK